MCDRHRPWGRPANCTDFRLVEQTDEDAERPQVRVVAFLRVGIRELLVQQLRQPLLKQKELWRGDRPGRPGAVGGNE